MDIKLTEKPQEIEKIREFKILMENLESLGRSSEFSVRCVYKKGNIDHFLFPYSDGKWSKKPKKSLLDRLDITLDVLADVLGEFISLDSRVDQTISTLVLFDFMQGEESDD